MSKPKQSRIGPRLGVLAGMALTVSAMSFGAYSGYRWQQHELEQRITQAQKDYSAVYKSLELAQTEIARLHSRPVSSVKVGQGKQRQRIGG